MRTIRDCKVAVVGGCGFLGSHLVNHLIDDRGCKVIVVDDLSSGRLEFLHNRAEFEKRDISVDEDVLRGIFAGFGARFVFNYAAKPFVPFSYAHPVHVFAVNALGALKIINAAQESGAEAILQVSSAELYGEGINSVGIARHNQETMLASDRPSDKLDEESPVIPHSSYGASKAAIDYLVQAAWKERKTPCIALRQFNCVGERETHPYVIPEIISQLFHPSTYVGQYVPMSKPVEPAVPIVYLGNDSYRDFLYAGDAVRLAVELLERGEMGQVYNLGSEESISIYNLAQKIADVIGCGRIKVEQDPARVRPWEIWHLCSDNSKLRDDLMHHVDPGFWTMVPLDEALRRTVKWYEGNGRKWPWET